VLSFEIESEDNFEHVDIKRRDRKEIGSHLQQRLVEVVTVRECGWVDVAGANGCLSKRNPLPLALAAVGLQRDLAVVALKGRENARRTRSKRSRTVSRRSGRSSFSASFWFT
jgi:hypothetical protein